MNILYSTGCPKCKVVMKKLEQANINYEVCNDSETMREKGIQSLPVLEVEGKMYNFKDAVDYINSIKK